MIRQAKLILALITILLHVDSGWLLVLASHIEDDPAHAAQPIQRTEAHSSAAKLPETHSESEDCPDESIVAGEERFVTNPVQQEDTRTSSQESKNETNEEECEEDQADVEGQSVAADDSHGGLDVNASNDNDDGEYSSRATKQLIGRPKRPTPSPARSAPKTRPSGTTKRAIIKSGSNNRPVAKSPTNKIRPPDKNVNKAFDFSIGDLFRPPKAKLDEGDGFPGGIGFAGCGRAPLNELTKGYFKRGQTAGYGEFPSFADLKIQVGGRLCSGVLISNREVLTTADCVKNVSQGDGKNNWTVILGEGPLIHNRSPHEVAVPAIELCVSPKHQDDGHRFNWAIIALKKRVNLTDHIQPACLPGPEQKIHTYGPAAVCYLVASGEVDATFTHKSMSIVLATNVTKMRVENVACEKEFGAIGEDRVCYKGVNPDSAACKGDLGGPVLCLSKDKRWTLMGLLSYGPDSCAGQAPSPTVFTRIRTSLVDIYRHCGPTEAMRYHPDKADARPSDPDSSFGPPATLDEGIRSMDGGGFPGCGKAPKNPLTKAYIIKGLHAYYGEFPQYVQLYIRDSKGRTRGCAGTLVSDRHIISAAHCFMIQNEVVAPGTTTVAFGEDYMDYTDAHEFRTGISEVCLADKHTKDNRRFDWALLTVKSPVKFNDYTQPACLPRPDQKVKTFGPESVCFGVGAGSSGFAREGNQTRDIPSQFVRKMRAENVACSLRETGPIDVDRVCYAGANNSGLAACLGDSGGPVICLDEKKRWTLMAVTSYSVEFCNDPTKSVYGRVRNFLHQIREICKVDLLR